MVEIAGRLELLEAKWTELPTASDAVNLAFVRHTVGTTAVLSGTLVCRTPSSYPLGNGFHAMPVAELK